ncbi:MAG: TonB-dependent receptor [Phormidesmis sp.]
MVVKNRTNQLWQASSTGLALGLGLVAIDADTAHAIDPILSDFSGVEALAGTPSEAVLSLEAIELPDVSEQSEYVAVTPTWVPEISGSELGSVSDSFLPVTGLAEQQVEKESSWEDVVLFSSDSGTEPESDIPQIIALNNPIEEEIETSGEEDAQTEEDKQASLEQALGVPEWLEPAQQIVYDSNVPLLISALVEEEEEEEQVLADIEFEATEIPAWLKSPQEISYNPDDLIVWDVDEQAEKAEESLPTTVLPSAQISYNTDAVFPDDEDDDDEEKKVAAVRTSAQISYNTDAVLLDDDDERISYTPSAQISEQSFTAQGRSVGNYQLLSGDSTVQIAVAPTWSNLTDVDEEIPDWVEQLNRTTTISLSPDANEKSKQPELDDSWISITPEVLERRDRTYDGISISVTATERSLLREDRMVPRLAISEPGISDPSQIIYDARALPQISITPLELANASNEEQISVSASQVEILTPQSGAILNIPSTPVALRFPVGAKIALLVNGQLIDDSQVGRTETDPETDLRIQTWYGLSLEPGENLIEVVSTETGQVFASSPVVVRGEPAALNLFVPSTLPADGISTVQIRGQLVDDVGIASLWNTTVTLNTTDGRFLGADQKPDHPGFQVPVVEGAFSAELQSSLDAQLVQIQAKTPGFEAFRQIQFQTPQRSSLISGVVDLRFGARGTDFYDSFREFLPVDGDDSYEFDVNGAVFATGNLGEWLYTGAYNSDRSLNENCRGESTLFRSGTGGGDCINSYATYGDDSSSNVVAPSLDSVYLRLERNSPTSTGIDYAMWGDFNTEELSTASQLFTATNRQLHGFKTNYNFGQLAVTGLYANNVEGFQRDTIAPDGTSGFYFTSQRDLVPGSETVFLELEELERPGTVLARQLLARGLDYEVDYDRGTLLFNDPVMRTTVADDGVLLVRRIVTTYQFEDGDNTDIYAGRLQYNLNRSTEGYGERDSWLGATYFSEEQGNRAFTLYGADAQISLGENAKLTAEIAQSYSEFADSDSVEGTAYRIEVDGDLGRAINGRAYYRSTDAGFSNLATSSFVPGQTRYGAQVTGQVGRDTSLRARYDRETNSGSAPAVTTVSDLLAGLTPGPGAELDNSLTTYSLGVSQRIGRANAEFDWIHRDRSDRINGDFNTSSDQLRTRLTTPITNKLSIVAQNEINLSSDVDPIYPSRTLVGLNWEAMPWLNIGLNQVFYGGGGNDRGSYTSLDVTGEHTFASDTTVRGRFSTVDGRQVGGSIGLEQGINLAPGLDLDLGYEKVFSTLGNETAAGSQFRQPVAVGSGASSLGLAGGESYSVGLSYTDNADFQASTRFEHRTSSRSSNTVFNLSALGRLSPAFTVLGDYRLAMAANQGISGLGTTSLLKLGLAYRQPENDKLNALLRYEYRANPNSIPTNATAGSSTETQEHILSAEAIYAPNWRWELYGKYALRNSRTAINVVDSNFSNSSTVQLAQARATYRLGYRWDVVGEARWIGGSGFNETGYSAEAGYYPLPDLRLSAGYSGGAVDTDFGDNRSSGGFYVGVTAKLSGLLNGFGTQPRAPYQQTESAVTVSQDADESVSDATITTVDEINTPLAVTEL